MKKTIVVNIFGGPGTMKSIACALIFAKLKIHGVNCEMSREFAKDIIWQGSAHVLDNQHMVYGEQQRRIFDLKGKVDVVVTDAPLLNSVIYDKLGDSEKDKDFHRTVINEFNRYDNRNYYFVRGNTYEQEGRYQDEDGAKAIDNIVLETLDENGFKYRTIEAWPETADVIARDILKELKLC
jgi:hypothetical protein